MFFWSSSTLTSPPKGGGAVGAYSDTTICWAASQQVAGRNGSAQNCFNPGAISSTQWWLWFTFCTQGGGREWSQKPLAVSELASHHRTSACERSRWRIGWVWPGARRRPPRSELLIQHLSHMTPFSFSFFPLLFNISCRKSSTNATSPTMISVWRILFAQHLCASSDLWIGLPR